MTRSPHDIIRRPVVTEKATKLMEQGRYVFAVDANATKPEIKQAIESLFKVKVVAVNTVSMPGKPRRLGVFRGRTPEWKKAIVTLAKGQTIRVFEGM